MTIESWLRAAVADAERRRLPELKPILEALARSQGQPCDEAFVGRVLRLDVESRGEVLAPYKRVKKVIVRASEFPKTTTGKIRRPPGAAEV